MGDHLKLYSSSHQQVTQSKNVSSVDNVEEVNGLIYCIRGAENDNPLYVELWQEFAQITLESGLQTFSLYVAEKVYNIEVEFWCGEPGKAEEHVEDGEGFQNLYDDYFANQMLDLAAPQDCQTLEDLILQMVDNTI